MMSLKAIIGFSIMGVALLIGIVASVLSVSGAKGPKERQFVIRACLGWWAIILSMLVLLYYVPSPYRFYLFAGYLILYPVLIYKWSTLHQLIRMVEQREAGGMNGAAGK
jgi:hypothetical protein